MATFKECLSTIRERAQAAIAAEAAATSEATAWRAVCSVLDRASEAEGLVSNFSQRKADAEDAAKAAEKALAAVRQDLAVRQHGLAQLEDTIAGRQAELDALDARLEQAEKILAEAAKKEEFLRQLQHSLK